MNYYNEIKKELIDNEVYKRIKDYSKNKYELERYYNVGKLLVEAQGGEERAKYGDGLIKEYANKLTVELGKGYTISALKRMRQFYLIIQKGATMSHLSWSHYVEMLQFSDLNIIKYYIKIAEEQNLSVRELRNRIKFKEYERLGSSVKAGLINTESSNVSDKIKHPIIIKNIYDTKVITEKMLKNAILENIEDFLIELGNGFTFIKSEYKIKLGNRYNYIDMLLFNIEFNCYVVVELKVTELKKEHVGQIMLYMSYVDDNVKKINHNKTIGIIICKYNNEYVIRYCYNENIYETTYELV